MPNRETAQITATRADTGLALRQLSKTFRVTLSASLFGSGT